MITARVVNVQRMSTEDGAGIRTTVFLKGCSLACSWCHNPESIATKPEVVWHEWKCIGCDGCNDVCEANALLRLGDEVVIDRERCTGGTACANVCPAGAIERIGAERELDDLTIGTTTGSTRSCSTPWRISCSVCGRMRGIVAEERRMNPSYRSGA